MLKFKSKLILKIIVVFLTVTIAGLYSYLSFLAYFNGKIFPGVKIADFSASGNTPQQAQQILEENYQKRLAPLTLTFQEQTFVIEPAIASPVLDIEDQVNIAFRLGRSGNTWLDFKNQLRSLLKGTNLTLQLNYKKPEVLLSQINHVGKVVKKDPLNARIIMEGEITVANAEDGIQLDEQLLLKQLENYLTLQDNQPDQLPVKTLSPNFTTIKANNYAKYLKQAKNSPLILRYNNQSLAINDRILFNLLNFTETNPLVPANKLLLNESKVASFLEEMSSQIDQPTYNAKFTFDPQTKRVREFQAAQPGKMVDLAKTTELITKTLEASVSGSLQETSTPINLALPVIVTQPEILTADVNNFGIKDLIGQGVSHFTGSIENRIYNIKLAASRLNGILIAPGETFSFNQTVGEISAATGYKQAYVIKSGRTVLDDGGGVCQVSTTIFRAALNAGLPIVQRTAHAYRVSYYEQGSGPGLDATVYAPSVDFKFKNNTPAHILVQSRVVGSSLYIDFYGASDGRTTVLTSPKIWSQTPPLPEIRQEDPDLPRGTVKQVDWPAWGANVSFGRTVTKNGEELIKETWNSNYRPWQAVYLIGTKD